MSTFYNYDFTFKEWKRPYFTELKLNFLNISSVFIVKVKQTYISFIQFGVFNRVNVNYSSNQTHNVLDRKAKFIKTIDIKLLLHYILDHFKMLI